MLLWDRRVVEKFEVCAGSLVFLVLSKMPKINLLGRPRVFMFLIQIVIDGFYGMNWLNYLAGGTCRGALGEDRVQPIFV